MKAWLYNQDQLRMILSRLGDMLSGKCGTWLKKTNKKKKQIKKGHEARARD